jgi:hypothetical protein
MIEVGPLQSSEITPPSSVSYGILGPAGPIRCAVGLVSDVAERQGTAPSAPGRSCPHVPNQRNWKVMAITKGGRGQGLWSWHDHRRQCDSD